MVLQRVFAAAAFVVCIALVAPSYGQEKDSDKLKLNKTEMAHLQTLSELVDAVMSGKEPAPADVKLTLRHHFVKSTANVFVPYMLEITGGKFAGFPVAMYVRAVRKPAPADVLKTKDYAFTDIHFFPDAKSFTAKGADTVEVARALELPPGEFDLYIAMTETPARNAKTPAKRVVHVGTIAVPDLSTGLTTSSIIVGTNMEEGPQQMTAREQMAQPFTIAGHKITPTFDHTFPKSGELLFLFLIYNEGATPGGKPDLDVNYVLFRAAETKPFGKLATTAFNETTLPPEFSLGAGHQVLVGQGIPLGGFAPGSYKLEIRITDKTNSQTITRDVAFTVVP